MFIHVAPFGSGRPSVVIHLMKKGFVYEILCFVVNVVIDFDRVGWPGQAWQP